MKLAECTGYFGCLTLLKIEKTSSTIKYSIVDDGSTILDYVLGRELIDINTRDICA